MLKENILSSLERTFVASISQLAFCCHDAIEEVQNTENLPLLCYENLASANLCTIHIHRICNIFEHLLHQDESTTFALKLHTFDPEEVLSELSKSLTDTLSGYIPIKIDLCSKLGRAFPLTVNQAKFEFAFLNILYCCVRSANYSRKRTTKITLSVKELKDSLVFYIKDNGKAVSPYIVDNFLAGNLPISDSINPYDSLISFSFDVAAKIINDMDGAFSYKALKSGNRYGITLPKFPQIPANIINSPASYIPTRLYFDQIFKDIQEEAIYKKKYYKEAKI